MTNRAGASDPEVPRWGAHPGLCVSCTNARVVKGAQSIFWMCELAASDPRYRRYPALPVLSCAGHTTGRPVTAETDADP
ncbi:MAG: hypothetical protein NVSMB29_19840 [Candidatus Dormibacteria bacterium]